MKRWLGVAGLVFVGVAGWRIGGSLSSDALSMAVGILFGVLAGVPTALLVMAGDRRHSSMESASRSRTTTLAPEVGWPPPPHGYLAPPQAPVIVLAGNPQGGGAQGYGQPLFARVQPADWGPADRPERRFAVVGDEHLLEDW